MIAVRFHGRGGQGAKIASRILSRSGFLSGLHVQDAALFGAERRGAPVVSFARLSTEPIDERGQVQRPSLLVVMDVSLLTEAPEQVYHGVGAHTAVFVNADPDRSGLDPKELPSARYYWVDLNRIGRTATGRAFVSASAAAVAAKSVPVIKFASFLDAVEAEMAELGLTSDLIEKNSKAASAAYEIAPAVEMATAMAGEPENASSIALQAVPYLGSAQYAGPTIQRRGSAGLRRTGNWRTERPVIELGKCKRCFLCYLDCPDAAIQLDADNFPHIDYDHCKGCLICYEECPTDAIDRRPEA